MSTLTVPELIDDLCARFPDDAEDLKRALPELLKQKITTCERVARLGDNQWQRLGLPLGIEALLRDEVELALASEITPRSEAACLTSGHGIDAKAYVCDQPVKERNFGNESSNGLRRRRGGTNIDNSSTCDRNSFKQLAPPEDLETLWQRLLQETLPPEKRPPLEDMWQTANSDYDKYMLYLEYSSYLRKVEITDEEKKTRKKQLAPLLRECGLDPEEMEEDVEQAQGTHGIWVVFLTMFFVIAGLVYYAHSHLSPVDPTIDISGL